MNSKKKIRADFRKTVFERDKYQCVCCKRKGFCRQTGFSPYQGQLVELDAHHIQNRHLFKNGGYTLSNGITVCTECHIAAEAAHVNEACQDGFSPEELYTKIGSSFEKAQIEDRK